MLAKVHHEASTARQEHRDHTNTHMPEPRHGGCAAGDQERPAARPNQDPARPAATPRGPRAPPTNSSSRRETRLWGQETSGGGAAALDRQRRRSSQRGAPPKTHQIGSPSPSPSQDATRLRRRPSGNGNAEAGRRRRAPRCGGEVSPELPDAGDAAVLTSPSWLLSFVQRA